MGIGVPLPMPPNYLDVGGYGRANTYNMPPFGVACGKSFIALANPIAAVPSRASRSPETTAPAHPPTPLKIAPYCFPSGPLYVTGWPIIPDPHLNFHSSLPLCASSALNQPSIVP